MVCDYKKITTLILAYFSGDYTGVYVQNILSLLLTVIIIDCRL